MCFTCWLRSDFSLFLNIDYLRFTWYLVAADSRIRKQCGVEDVRQDSALCTCLKMSKTCRKVLTHSCG